MNMPANTPSSPASTPPRRAQLRKAFGRLFAQGQGSGPPDLEEMWRDFTRKLSSLFGMGKKSGEPGPGGFQPDPRSAGVGAALVGLIVVVVWLFSGSFIVQEGQKGVVTTF